MANQAETDIMRVGMKWNQDLIGELTAKIQTLQFEMDQANPVWAPEYARRIEVIRQLQEVAAQESEKLEVQLDTQAM
jgi:hypothetical protein